VAKILDLFTKNAVINVIKHHNYHGHDEIGELFRGTAAPENAQPTNLAKAGRTPSPI